MTISAFVNTPPETEADFWIVRSILLAVGLQDVDPSKGTKIPPFRPSPDQYQFESRGPNIVAGAAVGIGIMVLFTGSRLLLRYLKSGLQWGWDDWFIIPGVTLAVTFTALQIALVQYAGAGKHIYDVTYHELYMFNWLATFGKIIFFVSVGIIKMSITMFNMRLTGLTSPKWRIGHWTFFGVLVAYTITALFVYVFQCDPPKANFDSIAAGKLNTAPKCISENKLGSSLSSIHVTMDFCLLAVPIIVLWKVQMPWGTKIRFFFVFGIGAMSCIGSVMRQLEQANLKSDPLYNYLGLSSWTAVDLTCGVIAANLPTLSVLIPRRWKSFHDSRSSTFQKRSQTLHDGRTSTTLQDPSRPSWSKESQEGIMRHVDIELQFQDAGSTKYPYPTTDIESPGLGGLAGGPGRRSG